MKLWEILKEENVGKKYKDNEGGIYDLLNNEFGNPSLYYNKIHYADFTQNDIITLEFEEIKPTGWERVKENNLYYYVNPRGAVHSYEEAGDATDDGIFANYNYFSTKEKAEQVRDMILLQRMMIKFYDENDGKVDWTDTENEKYNIYYDYEYNSWETTWTYTTRQLNQIYFSTEELVQRCIDEVIKPFMEGKDNE